MIDFVKIELHGIETCTLLRNPHLKFTGVFDQSTGETFYPYTSTKYKDLEFKIFESGRIILQGSLHKYSNQGWHNYNQFSYSNLVEVIQDLEEKFNINPDRAVLRNLEFGVNVALDYSPNNVLRALKEHSSKPFNAILQFRDYRQVKHSYFLIKAYNKGVQFNLDENIFRFEIKVRKMRYLKRFDILCLSDLKNKKKLKELGVKLFDTWLDCLYFDKTISKDKITSTQRAKWRDTDYWVGLREKHKKKDKNKPSRERRKYKEIQTLYSSNQQEKLGIQILKTYFNLLDK